MTIVWLYGSIHCCHSLKSFSDNDNFFAHVHLCPNWNTMRLEDQAYLLNKMSHPGITQVSLDNQAVQAHRAIFLLGSVEAFITVYGSTWFFFEFMNPKVLSALASWYSEADIWRADGKRERRSFHSTDHKLFSKSNVWRISVFIFWQPTWCSLFLTGVTASCQAGPVTGKRELDDASAQQSPAYGLRLAEPVVR